MESKSTCHMTNEKRLIDANVLIRDLTAMKSMYDAIELDGMIKALKEAPIVYAVEAVHAHWEDGYAVHNGKEGYKSIDCSNCNGIFKIESEDREYGKERFKVCPFCGAVMDEVTDNA